MSDISANSFGTQTDTNPADQQALAAYPQMAWALSDPELGPLLRQAAAAGDDASRLEGALEATTWWKTHDQAAQEWASLSAESPAEAQSRVDAETLAIRNAAVTMGATLTGAQEAQLATASLTNGWTQDEINQHITTYLQYAGGAPTSTSSPGQQGGFETDLSTGRRAYYGPDGEPASPDPSGGPNSWTQPDGTKVFYTTGKFTYGDPNRAANVPGAQPFTVGQPGTTGVTVDQLRQQAQSYLVPVSDATLFEWSKEIADGRQDPKSFQTYLEQQATSLYPTAASAIKSGQTMAQYSDPYKQIASQVLNINPDDVNFLDPKWSMALMQAQPDGTRQPMSLNDFQTMLMSDPKYGYQNTPTAINQAAAAAQTIGRLFGRTTGGTTLTATGA